MAEYTHVIQPFEPVFDEKSEILILGSLPSVKSRKNGFYYGHPQNRFWKVLSAVIGCEEPGDITQKKDMLLSHHIALWDVIYECDIKGSSDSSIKNVVTADIAGILQKSRIRYIYANGKTAEKYYKKYIEPDLRIKAVVLPSSSPANAAFSLSALINSWERLLWVFQGHYRYQVKVDYKDYLQIMQDGHMKEMDSSDFALVWRELFGATSQVRQDVSVWYQVSLSGKQVVVMTLGTFFDEKIEMYEQKEQLYLAYMVDCLGMGILRLAYQTFYEAHFCHTGLLASDMTFLNQNEMKDISDHFERLGVTEVKLNEAFVMFPQKTVVFKTKIHENACTDGIEKGAEEGNNPNAEKSCMNICEMCDNTQCANRQKPETVWNEAKECRMNLAMAQKIKMRKSQNAQKRQDEIENANQNYGYQRIMGKKGDSE